MKCWNCGAEIANGETKCPECGKTVSLPDMNDNEFSVEEDITSYDAAGTADDDYNSNEDFSGDDDGSYDDNPFTDEFEDDEFGFGTSDEWTPSKWRSNSGEKKKTHEPTTPAQPVKNVKSPVNPLRVVILIVIAAAIIAGAAFGAVKLIQMYQDKVTERVEDKDADSGEETEQSTAEPITEFSTFTNGKFNFSFEFPKDFTLMGVDDEDIIFAAISSDGVTKMQMGASDTLSLGECRNKVISGHSGGTIKDNELTDDSFEITITENDMTAYSLGVKKESFAAWVEFECKTVDLEVYKPAVKEIINSITQE